MSSSELYNRVFHYCVGAFSETDAEKLADEDLLIRDILFYGRLLQSKYGMIDFGELLKLVGIGDRARFQLAFNMLLQVDRVLKPHIVNRNSNATFSNDLMHTIEHIFYGSQSQYKLDELIPGWGISGADFINRINMLNTSDAVASLTAQAAAALQKLIGTNYHDTASDRAKVLHGHHKDGSEWFMILCIYSFESTLTEQAYNDLITTIIFPLTLQYVGAKTLLVVPAITGDQAEHVRSIASLFCMWDLSFVRMYHRLEAMLGTDSRSKEYKNRKEIIAQNFDKILNTDTTRSHAYLAKQAIDQLEVFF